MCLIFSAKFEHDLFFVSIIQNHVSFCKTEKCCKKFLNTILGYSISFRQINDTSTEIHKNKSFFTVWYKNVSAELVICNRGEARASVIVLARKPCPASKGEQFIAELKAVLCAKAIAGR